MPEAREPFKNLSNLPDIAFQFQPNGEPWPSVSAAHNGTPLEYRRAGKVRFVMIQGMMKEYWYNGGVTLPYLVPRYENMDTAAEYRQELENLVVQASKFSVTGRFVSPSNAPLENENLVNALSAGIYTQFGGITVSSEEIESIVRFVKDGDEWVKDIKKIDSTVANRVDNIETNVSGIRASVENGKWILTDGENIAVQVDEEGFKSKVTEDLKSDVSALQTNVSENNSDINSLNAAVQSLETSSSSTTQRITDAEVAINSHNQSINSIEGNTQANSQDIEDIKQSPAQKFIITNTENGHFISDV